MYLYKCSIGSEQENVQRREWCSLWTSRMEEDDGDGGAKNRRLNSRPLNNCRTLEADATFPPFRVVFLGDGTVFSSYLILILLPESLHPARKLRSTFV